MPFSKRLAKDKAYALHNRPSRDSGVESRHHRSPLEHKQTYLTDDVGAVSDAPHSQKCRGLAECWACPIQPFEGSRFRSRRALWDFNRTWLGSFVPYVETKHSDKPGTVAYFKDGAKMLGGSDLTALRLDEVNDQHAQRFTTQRSKLSASRVNCGLRTLRRALNLAYQWGTLEHPAKITGERRTSEGPCTDGCRSNCLSCRLPSAVAGCRDDHSRNRNAPRRGFYASMGTGTTQCRAATATSC